MNNFIICWDCLGLECIVPVTELQKENIINILSDKPEGKSVNEILNMLLLRARYNPQRFYEIYTISAPNGIDKKDIKEMFINDPQIAADTIRRIGNKVYNGKPIDPKRIKITGGNHA